jgi:hypothetical protein
MKVVNLTGFTVVSYWWVANVAHLKLMNTSVLEVRYGGRCGNYTQRITCVLGQISVGLYNEGG